VSSLTDSSSDVASAPAAGDVVHFVGASPPRIEPDTSLQNKLAAATAFAAIGFVVLGVIAENHLGIGMSDFILIGLVGLIVAGFVVAISVSTWRWFRQRTALRELPKRPPAGWRYCCVAAPAWLAPCGELADVPFEPNYFNATSVLSRTWPQHGLALAVTLALWAATIGALWALGTHVIAIALLLFYVAPIVSQAIIFFAWPTYLRVLPGRVDIVRHNFLRRGTPQAIGFPLADCRILADLRKNTTLIYGSDDQLRLSIPLSLLPDRRRFVHRLFLAALSTYQPPPLEEQEHLIILDLASTTAADDPNDLP
jgi:hypothetical protein